MAIVKYVEPQVGETKDASTVNAVTTAMSVQSSVLDSENFKREGFDRTALKVESSTLCSDALHPSGWFNDVDDLAVADDFAGEWNLDGTDEPGLSLTWSVGSIPLSTTEVMRVRFYCQVVPPQPSAWAIFGSEIATVRLRCKLETGLGVFVDFDIEGTTRILGNSAGTVGVGYPPGRSTGGNLATLGMIKRPLTPCRGVKSIWPVFTFPPPLVSTLIELTSPAVFYTQCHLDVVKFRAVDISNIAMTLT